MRSTTCSTDCSSVMSLVSTSVTPSGAVRNWETVASSRSRRTTWSRRAAASTTLPAASRSAARRARRASSLAVTSRRTCACGAMTVVTSRPSATIPAPPEKEEASPRDSAWMISRWRRASSARTDRLVATVETTCEICGSRIAWLMSTPSHTTVGACGSRPISRGIVSTAAVTASGSARSTPLRSHHQAAARYMAPVSRYASPRWAATRLETVDLPDPLGPSIATTIPIPASFTPPGAAGLGGCGHSPEQDCHEGVARAERPASRPPPGSPPAAVLPQARRRAWRYRLTVRPSAPWRSPRY